MKIFFNNKDSLRQSQFTRAYGHNYLHLHQKTLGSGYCWPAKNKTIGRPCPQPFGKMGVNTIDSMGWDSEAVHHPPVAVRLVGGGATSHS